MKIAFFDSGVGGLTIFKEAFKSIKADYIYFADNLNTPYGIKSKETVKKIVIENVKKIINYGADIIVIACNTATSVAINDLRENFKDITDLRLISSQLKSNANNKHSHERICVAYNAGKRGDSIRNSYLCDTKQRHNNVQNKRNRL